MDRTCFSLLACAYDIVPLGEEKQNSMIQSAPRKPKK